MLLTILTFVFVLGIIVLIHEWGHFTAARYFGVRVDEFGIGFPPRFLSFKHKEVLYTLNWIPLGGFVKIKGENGENTQDPDSFGHKKAWQRFIILAAGVFMNVVLAVFLFSVGYMVGFPQVIDDTLSSSAKVRDQQIAIMDVLPESPAQKVGIEAGDKVTLVDGQTFMHIVDLQAYINAHVGTPVSLMVQRAQEVKTFTVAPTLMAQTNKGGIGVALMETGLVSYPIHIAVWEGIKTTGDLSVKILVAFKEMIAHLVFRSGPAMEVSGPVGIAVMTGEVSRLGFVYLMQFMAVLSLNLAIINFLPFPALDGGRIAFLFVEKIRGRSMNKEWEGMAHLIGFGLLMLLIVVVTYQDLLKYGGAILKVFN